MVPLYRIKIKLIVLFASMALFSGCAALGPSIVKFYDSSAQRNQIAILRVDKSKTIQINACDGQFLQRGAKYILLEPGQHEILFSIYGQTLFTTYTMRNKKYIDVEAGHTYILVSKRGFFAVGDEWFPELVDVTDDPKLHVATMPREENLK